MSGFDKFTLLDLRSNRLTGLLPDPWEDFRVSKFMLPTTKSTLYPQFSVRKPTGPLAKLVNLVAMPFSALREHTIPLVDNCRKDYPVLPAEGVYHFTVGLSAMLLNEPSHLERLSKNSYFPQSPSPPPKSMMGTGGGTD
jgi:hypothetical protein